MIDKNNIPINRLIDSVVKPVQYDQIPDGDLPYATHEGILNLGGIELRVYVLNTGQRIIDRESLEELFGDMFRG